MAFRKGLHNINYLTQTGANSILTYSIYTYILICTFIYFLHGILYLLYLSYTFFSIIQNKLA
jgi:hypothetical protein